MAKPGLAGLKQLIRTQKPAALPVPQEVVTAAQAKRFVDYFPKVRPVHGLTALDKHQFAQAVKDVRRLKNAAQSALATSKPKPIPRARSREHDELQALLDSQLAVNPSPMSWDVGLDIEEDQSYARPNVGPDLLRKLRAGMIVIQAELDLHHHNQDEAHEAMNIFLAVAKQRKLRCVRIIHGKGLSSFRREPVLKSKVRRWLQLRSDVQAYCEPNAHGGGGGAVLVLLTS
jgi:DNA-nicking Smr family endonuclease